MDEKEIEKLLESMPLPELERLLRAVIERRRKTEPTTTEDWVKALEAVMDQYDAAFRRLS